MGGLFAIETKIDLSQLHYSPISILENHTITDLVGGYYLYGKRTRKDSK